MASSIRLGTGGVRAYGRTMLDEGESAFVALSWGGQPPTTMDEAHDQLAPDRELLARLAEHRELPRPPVAPVHRAQRARAQGPELRADRGDHGRRARRRSPRRPAASGTGTTATRGSATPRSCCGRCTASASTGRRSSTSPSSSTRSAATPAPTATFEPADHVRHRRRDRPHRAHARPPLRATADSRPVRIGNGAYDQQPARRVGHAARRGRPSTCATAARSRRTIWDGIAGLVDTAIERAPEPDQGIWEMRGEPQHFVASKVMCWVAADRGVAPRADARRHRARRTVAEGRRRDARPRSATRASTTAASSRQHYDTDDLDASLLLIPIMGFLPARRRAGARHRPRDRRRAHQGRPRAALPGRVHRRRALAAKRARSRSARSGSSPRSRSIGEVERARALFEKLLSFAGPLLLYAEEIDIDHRPAPRQLPAGVHPPRAHRRRQPPHRRGTATVSESEPSGRRASAAASAGCPPAASSDTSTVST